MEDRRERVLQALHILAGDRAALTTDEEKAIIREYREICAFGYGRMEVDTVADLANQVARTPFRVVGNALTAAGQAAKNIESDIAKPAEYAEIPPPPDVLVGSVISGVGHAVEGVITTIKGAVDGVVETGDGLRREIQQIVGR